MFLTHVNKKFDFSLENKMFNKVEFLTVFDSYFDK